MANRIFSRDVTAAILVLQNKETAAILVYQTSPLGVDLFVYAKLFFCLSKPIWRLVTCVKTLYWILQTDYRLIVSEDSLFSGSQIVGGEVANENAASEENEGD